jgi:hypothetical protein
MPYEGNKRESVGYNAVMAVARLDDYSSPYDDGLKHFGGMCDAYFAHTGEKLYEAEVPPYYSTQEKMKAHLIGEGEWPHSEYLQIMGYEYADTEDLKRAAAIMRRYTAWAELVRIGRTAHCALCGKEITWECDQSPHGFWWDSDGFNLCGATDEDADDQQHRPPKNEL